MTGLSFTRQVCVLDLAIDSTGASPTRVGGTFAISTAPHAITQRWARAIVDAFRDLDGVRYNNSRFAGDPWVALFAPARSAMPIQPVVSLPLTPQDSVAGSPGRARRIGYRVI